MEKLAGLDRIKKVQSWQNWFENWVSGSSLLLSVLLLWCCFVLLFLEGRVVCHSRLTQHPQLKQEGYRHHSNPPEDPHSRSGPQKVNWQLCFLPMPIEKWDSNHPFLLFFLSLLGVIQLSLVCNQAFLLQLKTHLYGFLWGALFIQKHGCSLISLPV